MVEWQSVQPKAPCTLTTCFAGSIEMLLPLAEVIPAWPWHARQFSSCLRGCGGFVCARAERPCAVPAMNNRTQPAKTARRRISTADRALLRKLQHSLSLLLHPQIRQNLGVLFTCRQYLMARRAIVSDSLPIRTSVAAVMTAKATRRVIVAKIVRVHSPGHTHVGKDVAQVDGCDLLA